MGTRLAQVVRVQLKKQAPVVSVYPCVNNERLFLFFRSLIYRRRTSGWMKI